MLFDNPVAGGSRSGTPALFRTEPHGGGRSDSLGAGSSGSFGAGSSGSFGAGPRVRSARVLGFVRRGSLGFVRRGPRAFGGAPGSFGAGPSGSFGAGASGSFGAGAKCGRGESRGRVSRAGRTTATGAVPKAYARVRSARGPRVRSALRPAAPDPGSGPARTHDRAGSRCRKSADLRRGPGGRENPESSAIAAAFPARIDRGPRGKSGQSTRRRITRGRAIQSIR